MEKILELYFTNQDSRIKLLAHLYLMLMLTMITNKLLETFGIWHHIPTDITLHVIIEFVLSGSVLIPIMAFVFTTVIFYYSVNGLLKGFARLFYWVVSRRVFGIDYLIFFLSLLSYIKVEANGTIMRGKRIATFIELLDDLKKGDDSWLVKFAEVVNACLVSSLIAFYYYDIDDVFPLWFKIPFIAYASFYPINMVVIYIYSFRYNELLEILMRAQSGSNASIR